MFKDNIVFSEKKINLRYFIKYKFEFYGFSFNKSYFCNFQNCFMEKPFVTQNGLRILEKKSTLFLE